MILPSLVESEIAVYAAQWKLDPRLVRAIVCVESGGNPYAWRPEPRYRYLWDVAKGEPFRLLTVAERASEEAPSDFPCLAGSPNQEWWGQQASFGVLQIMGAVARERGFKGLYLTELCNPSVNLEFGCSHLASLMDWANGDEDKACRAYNAGRGGVHSSAADHYSRKVREFRQGDHQ